MTAVIPDPEHEGQYLIGSVAEGQFGVQVGAGVLVNVHHPGQCAGEWCVIHRPSAHHMREWPLNWRDDRGLMERICPHGVGHPDPDSMEFFKKIEKEWMGVHGCDGCCSPPG